MKKTFLASLLMLAGLVSFAQLEGDSKSGDSIAMENFKSAAKAGNVEQIPKSSLGSYSFNPHDKKYEYIPYATPATTNTEYFNSVNQPLFHKMGRYFSNNPFLLIGYFLISGIGLLVYFNRKSLPFIDQHKKRSLQPAIKQAIWLFIIGGVPIFALVGGLFSDDYLKSRYVEATEAPIWGTGAEIRWKTLLPCSFLLVSLPLSLLALFLHFKLLKNKVN